MFSLLGRLKLAKLVGSREPTHRDVGNKPHPTLGGGFLSGVGSTGSNSRQIVGRWLFMYDTLS